MAAPPTVPMPRESSALRHASPPAARFCATAPMTQQAPFATALLGRRSPDSRFVIYLCVASRSIGSGAARHPSARARTSTSPAKSMYDRRHFLTSPLRESVSGARRPAAAPAAPGDSRGLDRPFDVGAGRCDRQRRVADHRPRVSHGPGERGLGGQRLSARRDDLAVAVCLARRAAGIPAACSAGVSRCSRSARSPVRCVLAEPAPRISS